MEYREEGVQTFSRMMGEEAAQRMQEAGASGGFMSDSANLALDFAFGAVWSRPGLEMKVRSIVVISILIATGKYAELRNHIRIGIRNGLTEKEIEEVMLQAIPYLGFPAVASAQAPVIETLREFGLAEGVSTPQERKML